MSSLRGKTCQAPLYKHWENYISKVAVGNEWSKKGKLFLSFCFKRRVKMTCQEWWGRKNWFWKGVWWHCNPNTLRHAQLGWLHRQMGWVPSLLLMRTHKVRTAVSWCQKPERTRIFKERFFDQQEAAGLHGRKRNSKQQRPFGQGIIWMNLCRGGVWR